MYFLHLLLLTHSHFVHRACCRWAELRTNMHNINEKVKAMLEGQDVKYRHHIGGAVYVSVTMGCKCIDFRKSFVPDGETEPKTTRTGITLCLPEWEQMPQLITRSTTKTRSWQRRFSFTSKTTTTTRWRPWNVENVIR